MNGEKGNGQAADRNGVVRFRDVSFYFSDLPDDDSGGIEAVGAVNQVFSQLNLELPAGMLSVVGENGIGKSTLLMLAGARLIPTAGNVTLYGRDTSEFAEARQRPELEEKRNRLVSVIYQNMEFETNESIGTLLEAVAEMGNYGGSSDEFLEELRDPLELDAVLSKRMQELSKGQLQRAIIAFSLLYGSRMVIMDEPVFALEQPQKERTFEYLLDYSRRSGTSIYYSAHDLDLTQKYSDTMLLLQKTDAPLIGPTSEIYTRDNLEQAFQAPLDTLYRRDHLYREMLMHTLKR